LDLTEETIFVNLSWILSMMSLVYAEYGLSDCLSFLTKTWKSLVPNLNIFLMFRTLCVS
jgi:hypothetical protein